LKAVIHVLLEQPTHARFGGQDAGVGQRGPAAEGNGTLVGLLTIGLAPTNGTTGTLLLQTVDQLVAKTLVVSFTMIMGDVVGERSSKMPFHRSEWGGREIPL